MLRRIFRVARSTAVRWDPILYNTQQFAEQLTLHLPRYTRAMCCKCKTLIGQVGAFLAPATERAFYNFYTINDLSIANRPGNRLQEATIIPTLSFRRPFDFRFQWDENRLLHILLFHELLKKMFRRSNNI